MPIMEKRPSGGIVFKKTRQEWEIHEMKKQLQKEYKELTKIKSQLKEELEEVRKLKEALAEGVKDDA